jgi:hypothetical protein
MDPTAFERRGRGLYVFYTVVGVRCVLWAARVAVVWRGECVASTNEQLCFCNDCGNNAETLSSKTVDDFDVKTRFRV